MNHCPVYQNIGGHPYGWVYPGPIGSILTPAYVGLENAGDLPNAATLCNQCGVVCPVKIPLPDLMRKLREQQVERKLRPFRERTALKLWTFVASRPALYAPLTRIAARLGRWLGGSGALIHRLPGNAWTSGRDMPAPRGKTFRELYAARSAQGAAAAVLPTRQHQRSASMSARDRILGRMREALGRTGPAAAQDLAAIDAKLRDHPRGPLPLMNWEPLAQFRARCLALSSTVDDVSALDDVPAARVAVSVCATV